MPLATPRSKDPHARHPEASRLDLGHECCSGRVWRRQQQSARAHAENQRVGQPGIADHRARRDRNGSHHPGAQRLHRHGHRIGRRLTGRHHRHLQSAHPVRVRHQQHCHRDGGNLSDPGDLQRHHPRQRLRRRRCHRELPDCCHGPARLQPVRRARRAVDSGRPLGHQPHHGRPERLHRPGGHERRQPAGRHHRERHPGVRHGHESRRADRGQDGHSR